jgi:hypothetical protein
MKAFFTKDFLLIRKWLLCTMAMVFTLAAVTIIWLHGKENFPPALIFALCFQIMVPIIWVSTTFRYEEMVQWNILAVSLPVPRRQQVTAKYLVTLVLAGIGGFSDLCLLLLTTAFGKGSAFYWLITCYLITGALIFICFALPVLYKFGISGFQLFLVSFFILIPAICLLLSCFSIPLPSIKFFQVFAAFLPILLVAVYFGSYKLSSKIFENKEI